MADLKGERPDAAATAIEPQDPEHVGTQLDPGIPSRRRHKTLTEREVERTKTPGRYHDRGTPGLLLVVGAGSAKSWIFRFELNGREHAMGLGGANLISLKEAREQTWAARRLLRDGINPLTARRLAKEETTKTSIANKWCEFAKYGITPTCFLYRHYDANGGLLYVGMSLHVWSRQTKHLQNAAWANSIFQIIIEPFASREELIEAEALAIKSEYPKFNKVHNNRMLRRALVAPEGAKQ